MLLAYSFRNVFVARACGLHLHVINLYVSSEFFWNTEASVPSIHLRSVSMSMFIRKIHRFQSEMRKWMNTFCNSTENVRKLRLVVGF